MLLAAREAIGSSWNAVHKHPAQGDQTAISAFVGKSFIDARGKRIKFLTDPTMLDELGGAGVLSFEMIYAGVRPPSSEGYVVAYLALTRADSLYLFCTCTAAFYRFSPIEPIEFSKSFENLTIVADRLPPPPNPFLSTT